MQYYVCIASKEEIPATQKWYKAIQEWFASNNITDSEAKIFIYTSRESQLAEWMAFERELKKAQSDIPIVMLKPHQLTGIVQNDYQEFNYFYEYIKEAIYGEGPKNWAKSYTLLRDYLDCDLEEKDPDDFPILESAATFCSPMGAKKVDDFQRALQLSGSLRDPKKVECIRRSLLKKFMAKCMQEMPDQFTKMEVIETYIEAYNDYPDNLAPLFEAVALYRCAGLYEDALSTAIPHIRRFGGLPTLFGDREKATAYDRWIDDVVRPNRYLADALYTYLYLFEFEVIIALFSTGRFEPAYQYCNRVMLRKMVIGDGAIKQLSHFKSYCIEHIKDRFIEYDPEKVAQVTARARRPDEEKSKDGVIFTVTTCKRFDLFEKTINSLINATLDVEMIQEWLCVDDNSSEEDRELMRERYPFFNFILKGPEEKGHSRSMNMVRDYVIKSGYKYTMHFEDDWQTVAEMEFIRPSIRIIEEAIPGLGIQQVVHNRQYVQLIRPRDIDLKGGIQQYLGDQTRFILHEFHPNGSEEQQEFWRRVGGGYSACYWPYYSLNPSVMTTDVYKYLGPFREDVRHFEMDYANRYTNAGWRTAFLDGIFRLHIGKLIGEEGKKNAYELNDLTQFAEGA